MARNNKEPPDSIREYDTMYGTFALCYSCAVALGYKWTNHIYHPRTTKDCESCSGKMKEAMIRKRTV